MRENQCNVNVDYGFMTISNKHNKISSAWLKSTSFEGVHVFRTNNLINNNESNNNDDTNGTDNRCAILTYIPTCTYAWVGWSYLYGFSLNKDNVTRGKKRCTIRTEHTVTKLSRAQTYKWLNKVQFIFEKNKIWFYLCFV